MDEIWLAPNLTPAELIEWLQALASVARVEQQEYRMRSQVPVGDAALLRVASLPLPTRSRATAGGAIYARPPSPALPFGDILVLALLSPAAPPDAGEVSDQPGGAQPTGSWTRIELASDPRFPLVSQEVIWHFTGAFPDAQRLTAGRRSGTLLWINRLSRTPSTGAPVLSCNLWLEEQLLRLKDPRDRRTLYRPWLERYREARGLDPADPERSFRAAVQGCERRLRKREAREQRSGRDLAHRDHSVRDAARETPAPDLQPGAAHLDEAQSTGRADGEGAAAGGLNGEGRTAAGAGAYGSESRREKT